jgi:trehalose/maltose hydrolase-like predicted phosphorylase
MDKVKNEETAQIPFPVSPTSDPAWRIEEAGFNLAREHEIESLFAISNGYVGSRGSLAEGSPLSDPATYIAGMFDAGGPGTVPELAAAPDWMRLEVRINGQEFRLEQADCLYHRRVLDLRQGLLWREFAYLPESGGVVRFCGCRLASLADRHVLLQSIRLNPENHFARLHLRIATEPVIERPGRVRLHPGPCSFLPNAAGAARVIELCTRRTGLHAAVATAGRLWVDDVLLSSEVEQSRERLVESWSLDIESGKTYRFERVVAMFTSRDHPQPVRAASRHLHTLLGRDFGTLVEAHVRAFERRWQTADVEVEGDEDAQRALRFAGYHLIGAANPEDERVSIGARALTGGAYKGHVFWDTEIFMLPFYLFTHPPAARALLMYRYHTLPAARDKARRLGCRGALYAWESTITGEENTPPHALGPDGRLLRILNGEQEQHISADVAYAVHQYWRATGDDEFMLRGGAEILIETARFWASRGSIEADGRCHIRTVIGPDEYHEAVDDNAYTNGMAQWNLECAAEAVEDLSARWPVRRNELARRLGLEKDEPERWRELAGRMYTGLDPETGLFEQFAGYFGLEDIDLGEYAAHAAPMDVILGRERVQRSRIVKQADAVMLVYLLWDRFPPEVREANFRYYEPRTNHGSSLSPAIHAAVAARLGDLDAALRYFRQAAGIDFANNMGNAAGGVHAAALGGLWQAAVFGFAGMRLLPDGLAFLPHCPPVWPGLRFSVLWRKARLRVRIRPRSIEINAAGGETAVPIRMGGAPPVPLAPGASMGWAEEGGTWQEVSS